MKKLKLMLGLLITTLTFSQQNVTINSSTFKTNLEIAEAQISKETMMLKLYEIDKFNPKYEMDNCTECPDGKSLGMDIDFKRGFKFPIEEKDSVFVRYTYMQQGLAEQNFNERELVNFEQSRNKTEEKQLQMDAETIKAKSAEISKQMMAGKISPEEAQKQMMALVEPRLKALDNSDTFKNIDNIGEYDDSTPIFSINFYNNVTLTETEAFSGYLWIKEFNEDRFVAVFRGEYIERCVEKRAAKSLEEEKKCSAKKSQYLPETGVLNEGSGGMTININIKEFLNNR